MYAQPSLGSTWVMSRGRNHCFAHLQRGSSEFVSSYRPAKGPVPFTWRCLIKYNKNKFTWPPCTPYTLREPRVHLRGESGPTLKTSFSTRASRWNRIQCLTGGGGGNKSFDLFTAFVIKFRAFSPNFSCVSRVQGALFVCNICSTRTRQWRKQKHWVGGNLDKKWFVLSSIFKM